MESIVHTLKMKEHHHLVLFLFLQLLSFSMNKASSLVDDTEREALLSFKSMVSDPRDALSGWNLSSPHCTWFGVSCSTGPVPLLGNMNKLVKLNLGHNNLSSTTEHNLQFIDSLVNCTDLEILILNSNQLVGELPSSVANLSTHLREFYVDDNFLSGSFPRGMENFRNLTVLSLHQNSFKSKVPNSIGVLHNLRRFSINQNMFFGDIPDSFSNLTQLYWLTMGNNQLSGRIPKSIGNCQRLYILGLFRNMLNGSIPKEIFGIASLSKLFLDQNAFSGSVPNEVDGLKQLEFMDVSDNQLSGNIPPTISDCSSLRSLRIARNKFSGPIPKLMVKLAGLESLDLSSNNLSGPIPQDLENLLALKNLNLSFNQLEGQVPRGGVFMNLSWDSLQGNNKLCGGEQEVAGKLRVPTCTTKKKQNISAAVKIIIPIASFVLLCVLLCFIWVLISHKKKHEKDKGTYSSSTFKGRCPKISYSEIRSATNGFAVENLIGKGAFGSVYKGLISSNGRIIQSTTPALVIPVLLPAAVALSMSGEVAKKCVSPP
ncbi:hypothetical protein HHK36_031708 [Tetracentron sinense]|uniref:Leucine-rich repeat-containing N-terminal plant-type domain-containing protein n=1 Tax=Tetracentron sinense TaxID=13715 RepID=A0A834Y9U1_TETSI|nr:hypothetical protein HHK36_031708 [Tetracentron sinense]